MLFVRRRGAVPFVCEFDTQRVMTCSSGRETGILGNHPWRVTLLPEKYLKVFSRVILRAPNLRKTEKTFYPTCQRETSEDSERPRKSLIQLNKCAFRVLVLPVAVARLDRRVMHPLCYWCDSPHVQTHYS